MQRMRRERRRREKTDDEFRAEVPATEGRYQAGKQGRRWEMLRIKVLHIVCVSKNTTSGLG